ncbi:MAG: hypothetical protein Q7U82_06815 [Gammaproteobacteria bacterium]|nr:hypothetical protein [Gammaproteobacteria bacterium]
MKNSAVRSRRQQAALCSISIQSAKRGADPLVIAVEKGLGLGLGLGTLNRLSSRRAGFRGGIVYR